MLSSLLLGIFVFWDFLAFFFIRVWIEIRVFEENSCCLAWFSVPVILSASFLENNDYYIVRDRLSYSIKVIFHFLVVFLGLSLYTYMEV